MIVNVHVFCDLDSARRFKRPPWPPGGESLVSYARRRDFLVEFFAELQMRVLASLVAISPGKEVAVKLTRLYHGWHRGSSPTEDRRLWEDARLKFKAQKTSKGMYLPDIAFGNQLTCGGSRQPLLDTLRSIDGVDRQKLVDTSLVADLLCFTRSESPRFGRRSSPDVLGLVIADDDDVLPGVFTAEAWGLRTHVLRVGRDFENNHLKTNGLTSRL